MNGTTHDWLLPDRVLHLGRRPLVMGIVNVTPDSFSDGGKFNSSETAIEHGLGLVQRGAELLDIGGESSRPGAVAVPLEEELGRVLPVVQGLAARTSVPLSVDTCKAEVARQALGVGAVIINDITALGGDPAMPAVVRDSKAGAILMHMQGTPATMQRAPHYQDVVAEVKDFFERRLRQLTEGGIAKECLVLDPGIGFGKSVEHNLKLIARLGEFLALGRPLCLGVSRKGFFGSVLHRPLEHRLAGSLAAVAYAQLRRAAQIVRVHDVEETVDTVTLLDALERLSDGA